MVSAKSRIVAVLAIALGVLPLVSCGNPRDDDVPPSGGDVSAPSPTTAGTGERSVIVAGEASSSDWPALTDDEGSIMSRGILGKALEQFPATLLARDAMIQPGETASVTILLGRGFGSTALKKYEDVQIVVKDTKDNVVLSQKTNRDGEVIFERAYTAPGNYYYRVSCEGQVDEKDVKSVLFGIYVRDKNVPIVICDMDKTLVQSSFAKVLAGLADAFDNSVNVVDRLVAERKMTVVYLTHRPDFLDTESRNWLRAKKYPPGPLVDSSLMGLFSGSEKFKTGEIAKLKGRYPKIELAIGDKIADSNAYVQNKVRSVLLPDIEWDKEKGNYWRDRLTEMAPVGDEVTVCSNWYEIEDAIFKDKSFPPSRVRQRIQEMVRKFR